jgi:hypothetical protein
MRSSTGKGSAAGPALKLWTRFTPCPETVVALTFWFAFLSETICFPVAGMQPQPI